jgi:hypothetical protein
VQNVVCGIVYVREDVVHLRNLAFIAALGFGALGAGSPAAAQGFFDFFGFGRRPAPPPQQVQPYAPFESDDAAPVERRADATPGATYCVRLCDGHFFPLPRGANAAETCSSFCPTAKTKVFSGGGIERAVASDGKRYSDLENAFAYRDKIVNGCTCNGRDALGIARVNVAEDPTLRAGDIVAASGGMSVYRGKAHGVAQFTPVDKSKVSKEMRSRLANMRIQPEYNGEDRTASEASEQPAETTGTPAASERSGKRERRTQR